MMVQAIGLSVAINSLSGSVPFSFRTDGNGQISISSGDPDPAVSVIRSSKLTPIAKMRALDVLRLARTTAQLLGRELVEDVGTTADGGVVLEFGGATDRELMVAIGVAGGWTYFSAAIDGHQVKAGILRDDGVPPAVCWVAGSRSDLEASGIVAG